MQILSILTVFVSFIVTIENGIPYTCAKWKFNRKWCFVHFFIICCIFFFSFMFGLPVLCANCASVFQAAFTNGMIFFYFSLVTNRISLIWFSKCQLPSRRRIWDKLGMFLSDWMLLRTMRLMMVMMKFWMSLRLFPLWECSQTWSGTDL